MSKINEFYAAAMADEASKAKIETILGDVEMEDADDAQLTEIGKVAESMGYAITLEEAKAYLQTEVALDVEVLDAAAGGGQNGSGKNTEVHCEGANSGVNVK